MNRRKIAILTTMIAFVAAGILAVTKDQAIVKSAGANAPAQPQPAVPASNSARQDADVPNTWLTACSSVK